MSTIAYAITRPAAANLSKMSIPFRRPVDLFIKHWWEHGACVKLVMPSPVDRRHDHLASSEIDPSRKDLSVSEPLSRFIKNTLYQFAFKAKTS